MASIASQPRLLLPSTGIHSWRPTKPPDNTIGMHPSLLGSNDRRITNTSQIFSANTLQGPSFGWSLEVVNPVTGVESRLWRGRRAPDDVQGRGVCFCLWHAMESKIPQQDLFKLCPRGGPFHGSCDLGLLCFLWVHIPSIHFSIVLRHLILNFSSFHSFYIELPTRCVGLKRICPGQSCWLPWAQCRRSLT